MKLLVSTVSPAEARIAAEAGADIIDIKNPAEGSLGAQSPRVMREIAECARAAGVAVSATLGDLSFQPGTAALAAFGAEQFELDYLKVGLHGTRTHAQAAEMLRAVRDAVRMAESPTALVACGYADFGRFDGLAPSELVRAAVDADCEFVMLDTAFKDGRGLFESMCFDELRSFANAAHQRDLRIALAGSIGVSHVATLNEIGADIIGVRGAVCRGGRRGESLDPEATRSFVLAVHDRRVSEGARRPAQRASHDFSGDL